ncbi:MAG: hypothetical protein ACT4OM_04930 [Actinomycetota bacterium]
MIRISPIRVAALVVGLLGICLWTSSVGLAASVNLDGGSMGAGTLPVTPCDAEIMVSFIQGSGDEITHVFIDQLAPQCVDQVVRVRLVDGGGAVVGSGEAVIAGAQESVAITEQPLVGQVALTRIAIS